MFWRSLAKVALPIAAQSLMVSAVAVADTLMLGGVEQNAMSAVSLATKVQFIQNIIIGSLIAAMIVLGAQYWGKRDGSAISRIFFMTLRIGSAVSVVFFIVCEFFPEYVMLAFTSDAELIRIASEYLRIAAWSYLIMGISQSYLALLKITDHAKDSAVISSCTVVMNILLNAVLIFGLLGMPALGVRGAAYATLFARIIELIWAAGLSLDRNHLCPDFRSFFVRDILLAGDFVRCLLPLIGAGMLWGVGFTAYSAFIGHVDADAPAANSVASSVIELVCCLCNGLASGGGILIGNALGAGELERGKLYGQRMVALSFICGILTSAAVFLITPLMTRIITLNETAYGYLRGMTYVMSVYVIGRAVNTVTVNGVFGSGGDTMFDMYSLAVMMWGIALPLAALGTFVFHWPVWLIYACTCLDEVGKIPWVMLHFRKYRWVRDITRELAE